MKRSFMKCLGTVTLFFAALAVGADVLGAPPLGAPRTIVWDLPANWEESGELSSRYGIGKVGEPDLPIYTARIELPTGGTFVSATLAEVEWEEVHICSEPKPHAPSYGSEQNMHQIPLPIAEWVRYGEELVYPEPDAAAYAGVYPSEFVVAGTPDVYRGVTRVPITVTPYKWDGTTRTLYKAKRLKVEVEVEVEVEERAAEDVRPYQKLKLSTSSQSPTSNLQPQIIIVTPHDFVDHWNGYAAFRKSTEAGKDFEFIVKDTRTIYSDAKYWTKHCEATKNIERDDNADALAIHHYLEDVYDANRVQYIILGAAPTKYQYDRDSMIPARYVVNGGSYGGMVCDLYYGCMDRRDADGNVIAKSAITEDSPEVWDYNCDGYYMGTKTASGYSNDPDKCVDWTMDVPVTRVPMMREYAENLNNTWYHETADDIMRHFTNNIAYAENPATWTRDKRWQHVIGGGYLFNYYDRGSDNEMVQGEHAFFDGGPNYFDPVHKSPAPDAETCPRQRHYQYFSRYRASRLALINTGGYVNTTFEDLYRNYGDVFTSQSHGLQRGSDPGRTYGALVATGIWRVFNMALPCDTGWYDYCPGGSYGITNCCCMGEAPLLCFNDNAGGLVTFNNSRYAYWGGFDGASSKMEGLLDKALYELDMNAGDACRYMHNNCGYTGGGQAGWVNLEVIMHGDPLIRLSPQYSRTWNANSPNYTWSSSAAAWTIEGLSGNQTLDYSKDLWVNVSGKGSQTFTIPDTDEDMSAARLTIAGDKAQTITLGGSGQFRVTDSTVITNANLVWNVAGGAGRNGIEFVGDPCDLTFEGTAVRYVGSKIRNVRNLNVSGLNVTFDSDRNQTAATDFDVQTFGFVGDNDLSEGAYGDYNVIRARVQGYFPDTMTIPVVNSRLELQTYNIGGADSKSVDKPLFYLTNAYLRVSYNPYWKSEYFVRPTYLNNGHIVGAYAQFGFGRPDSNGYDLYVRGNSSIEGDTPIMLTGELRVHLMSADAVLEISNPMANGHAGATGSIRVMGSGKVRITGETTFTGAITVENGAKLELAIAKAVKGDVTVKSGGELHLKEIPLEDIGTLTLESGSKTYLPQPTGTGIYQLVDAAVSQVEKAEDALVYDATNPSTPLNGFINEGVFVVSDNMIGWTGTTGTWVNNAGQTANWRNASGQAVGFTNGKPVYFSAQTSGSSATVTVSGEVKPGIVVFENANYPYTFGGSGSITMESLSSGYDVTYNVNLNLNSVLKVTGGTTTATNLNSPAIEVSGSGRLHVTDAITEPTRKIRAIRFTFASAYNASAKTAIQELRLFRDGGYGYKDQFVEMPAGTTIEDCAGQKIEILYCEGYEHAYEWLSTKPADEEESIKALIDCSYGSGKNKWWASSSPNPTWFTITFPEAVDPIAGYSFCTADSGDRNPNTWNVALSSDGTTFIQAASVSDYGSTKTHTWLCDHYYSTDTVANFDINSIAGALTVKAGGTLVLDGTLAHNLVLEEGATLAVTGEEWLEKATGGSGELVLPEEEGSVLIDASQAKSSASEFPILYGYNLTQDDLLKFRCVQDTAALKIADGNLYIVTAGVKKAPYTATLTSTSGSTSWSNLPWKDGDNNGFTWNNGTNCRSDGDATINVSNSSLLTPNSSLTIDLNVPAMLNKLSVGGNATDAITLQWGALLVPNTLVFSNYAGSVALNYGAGDQYALESANFVAGHDTDIPYASTGTLYIGPGMRALVPEWDYANVSGAGTLAIKRATRATAVDTATWANDNPVTGTNELYQGTWEIKNGNDYPKEKEVRVGANGLLKFTTVNDATGYSTYTTGLTIADGGEANVAKRDTFNRKLTLENGGKLTFTQDASDNGRIYDFYVSSSLNVTGPATSVIGGSAATEDADTHDPIVNSGIVALRRDAFPVTVAAGAALNVFAQWGENSSKNNSWIKQGGGLVAFHRATVQSGALTISAGAVRLVNKGQATTGPIVNQAELQLLASNNYEQTVANAISGAGRLVKKGPGTSVLTGETTYTGGTTVEAGSLRVAANRLQGALTLNAGATLDITGEEGLDEYVITTGTFTQGGGTVQLNGTALPTAEYKVADNRIVKNVKPDPQGLEVVWEGNSATVAKTMSYAVRKGKPFTLIVHMTNTTDVTAGSYIIGKISGGQTITPFCVAADEYTSFTTGGAIPNNSVSYDEKKSGGWWCGVGSRSNTGNATRNEELIGDEVSKLNSIYVAFSGTVNDDGTVANYVRMVFAHRTSGVDYTLSNTSSSLTISESLDTMNVNSSVDTLAFKVYLDYTARTVDQIKQAIADIEDPPIVPPYHGTVLADVDWTAANWVDSSATPRAVTSGDWDETVDADITFAGTTATITADRDLDLGALVITNSGTSFTVTNGAFTIAATNVNDAASTGMTVIGFSATNVIAGADTVLNSFDSGTLSIASGKKLTVKGGTVQETKTTNAGTLNFAGGTSASPIVYNADGGNGADLGEFTLAPGAYLKVTPNYNKIYNVMGADDGTSTLEVSRASGTGTVNGSQFRKLTLVANVGPDGFWIERTNSFDATVDVVAQRGIMLYGNDQTIGSLSGSGDIGKYGSQTRTLTITPSKDSVYSGASSHNFTIASSSYVQTLSGAFTGALTVNAGGKVTLGGSANPSGITSSGLVTVLAGQLTHNVTLNAGAVLNITGEEGLDEYVITTGTFTQGGGTVQLNGTALPTKDYEVAENKIVRVAPEPVPEILNSAYLWLDASDASTIIKDSDNYVTNWVSRNDGGKAATAYTGTYIEHGPAVLTGALNGNDVLDFGATNAKRDLEFTRSTSVRTVFMVAKLDQSVNAFYLGDSSSFNFHRGSNGNYLNSNNACNALVNGTYRNGVKIADPRNTLLPNDYGLITFVASDNVAASRICQDRGGESGNRVGGKQLAELVVFESVLSDDDRAAVESYLMRKWLATHKATVSGNTNWSQIEWTPAITDPSTAVLDLTVENGAVITLDNSATYKALCISGDATLKYAPTLSDNDYYAAFPGGKAVVPVTKIANAVIPASGTTISYEAAASTKAGYTTSVDANGFYIQADGTMRVGSVNVSFPGGNGNNNVPANRLSDNASYSGIDHGAYPVVGAKWNDVPAVNNSSGVAVNAIMADGTTKASTSINVALSNVANPYDMSGRNVPDRLLYGYCDDGSAPTATVTGIPYSRYRVVVYFSCDTAGGRNFGYAVVKDGDSAAVNYCGSATGTTGGNTIRGTSAWGFSLDAPAVAESVNYLVSDVMTSSTATIGTNKGSNRAGFAGFQIIDCTGEDRSVAYCATATADCTWLELWGGALPPAGADVKIINGSSADRVTVTIPSGASVGRMTIESAAGKELKFAGFANLTATAFDFSAAPGGVGFDATAGLTVADPLKSYIRDSNVKVIFHGAGENGATLTYNLNENKTVQGHWVFEGGKHALTYGNSVSGGPAFGAHATVDNPTVLVKNGTVLDFTGKDLSCWSGSVDVNGVIKVENGGRINMKDKDGTVYYRQRLALDPGAEFYVDMAANNFRLQGGTASEATAQLYVPAGGGTASIKPTDATRDSIRLHHDSTIGLGITVGEGSTLDIQTKITSENNDNNYEIAKYAAGTLKLSGDISDFYPHGYEKNVKFSVHAGILDLAMATEVRCGLWAASGATVELTGSGTTVSGVISGAGGVVRNGSGTVTLSGANTYTGTTTVSAGALVVAVGATLGTGNYAVAEGATLDLGTHRPTAAKLVASSQGTVIIKLQDTAEEETAFNAGQQVKLIDVEGSPFAGSITIIDATGAERDLKSVEIVDGKIAVTKADDAKVPPFNLTDPSGVAVWTAEGWLDSSDTPQAVVAADWGDTVAANIALASGEATRTLDRSIQLSTLNITNAGTLAIADAGDYTLTAATIDDSASSGATTLDFAPGAANITAGRNTIIRKGGTGKLTVGSGDKATLSDATFGAYEAADGSFFRWDNAETTSYTQASHTPIASTVATNAFNNATVTYDTGAYLLRVEDGDNVTLKKSGNYIDARIVMTGGNLALGGGEAMFLGKTAGTLLGMTGGTATFAKDSGSSTEYADNLSIGWSAGIDFRVDIAGGVLAVPNARILPWEGVGITVADGGTIRAKGIYRRDGGNSAASLAINAGGTVEVGAYGLVSEGNNKLTVTLNGGVLANSVANAVNVKGGITVSGASVISNDYAMTMTSPLKGSGAITKKGTETLALSDLANYTGAIAISSGTVDIGQQRGLTIGGAGSVKAQLTEAYRPNDVVTLFTAASGATTALAELKDRDGNVISDTLYTFKDGVVTFSGPAAKVGTTLYFTLNEALDAVPADGTVTLCTNVAMAAAYELGKSITLDGGVYEITGDGFTGSGTLTIAGGYIGVSGLPSSYSIIGGKYKGKGTWEVADGYRYVDLAELAAYEDYTKQVIAGEKGKTDEKVFPVSTEGTTTTYEGELAFTKAELVEKGVITSASATDAEVTTALNTPQANDLLGWQNAILGLDGTETAYKDIPVPVPVQTDDPSKVTIKLGSNVKVDTQAGATVTYKVKITQGAVVTETELKNYDQPFELDLPESGVAYYQFEVDITPAK